MHGYSSLPIINIKGYSYQITAADLKKEQDALLPEKNINGLRFMTVSLCNYDASIPEQKRELVENYGSRTMACSRRILTLRSEFKSVRALQQELYEAFG